MDNPVRGSGVYFHSFRLTISSYDSALDLPIKLAKEIFLAALLGSWVGMFRVPFASIFPSFSQLFVVVPILVVA